ncbi:DGQHR domain-containing protein [Dechloromonas denitrificans]|uniref:DGQHR domain-containing protein n=1 Tax=Dechloromonas denitrificans TaxID=281362 RepID=UPI001CF82B37|nr:DGQHR domain-containing protein [Dechloromonas denitrificans]UCV03703.1 DGQHR domain-containing protein [Dechloromonas denitrificans]
MQQRSILRDPYQVEIKALPVDQPLGTFYIAALDSKTLCEITHADVRRMYKERDIETYLGIQRPLNPNRVQEIKEFVKTSDACFPTGVILAVKGQYANYDEKSLTLTLRNFQNEGDDEGDIDRIEIAQVLDGQHRIEGLQGYNGKPFNVNIVVFVDIDIEDQAYLFSTVNLAQTKVNKSLVYDLFEYSKSRSPQKTCHNVAVALDQLEECPFHRRIKRLGASTPGRSGERLTQATFVESLLPYITKNHIQDRDLLIKGKNPRRANENESMDLIFRNMFLDNRDIEIADVILYYFEAARDRWGLAWESDAKGAVLGKTNGFRALMKLLRPAYLRLGKPGDVIPKSEFLKLFEKSSLKDEDFTIDNFKPGTSGESSLYKVLVEQLGLSNIAW